MKFRELYSEHTPRTILWRAFLAITFGLLGSASLASFTGRGHFAEYVATVVGVPLALASINLVICWSHTDTGRKLRELDPDHPLK